MAAYGDYATLCPAQTFTQASLLKSFPQSTEAPWTILQQWGPTVSGLKGFIVQIPEMDKIVRSREGKLGGRDCGLMGLVCRLWCFREFTVGKPCAIFGITGLGRDCFGFG